MKSIRTFLILVITGITLLVFSIQSYVSSTQVKEYTLKQLEEILLLQVSQEAMLLYLPIKEISDEAITLGNMIVTMPEYREDSVLSYIMKTVQKNKTFAGAGMAFEPYFYQADVKNHFPYIMKDKSGVPVLTWDYSVVDYHVKGWYKLGLTSQKVVDYSEPYPDQSDPNLVWITCVHPLEKNGKRIGVSEADFTLEAFKKQLAEIRVGHNGYAFALTKGGFVIGSHTGVQHDQTKDLTMKLVDDKDNDWKAVGEVLLRSNKVGIMKVKDNYAVYSPVGDTGMTLVLIYPMNEVAAGLNKLMYFNIGLMVVSIALFVFSLSYIVNRRITNPLKKLAQTANKVADGDLTMVNLTYSYNDEIGFMLKAFVTMNDHLRKMVCQVANVAEQLSATSEELHATSFQSTEAATDIAVTTGEISGKTSMQVEEVTQALLAVQVMTEAIGTIAENANHMSASSVEARREAAAGGDAVDAANEQMRSISQSVIQSAQVVRKLGDSSKQIGEIVGVISGIAGQTNLLALNAAIEAARAGEQGRGFAVVADEVRKLAEQSQLAAQKISTLITDIQRETDLVVSVMNQGTKEVEHGAEVISATGERFRQIVTQVRSFDNQIQKISANVQQVTNSSSNVVMLVENVKCKTLTISDNILTISAATEEQSASMGEITTTSRNLAALAEELNILMSRFTL